MNEYEHRLIHKTSYKTHLAKQKRPDTSFYMTLCGLSINPRWVLSNFKLGYGKEDITCALCLRKMEARKEVL